MAEGTPAAIPAKNDQRNTISDAALGDLLASHIRNIVPLSRSRPPLRVKLEIEVDHQIGLLEQHHGNAEALKVARTRWRTRELGDLAVPPRPPFQLLEAGNTTASCRMMKEMYGMMPMANTVNGQGTRPKTC